MVKDKILQNNSREDQSHIIAGGEREGEILQKWTSKNFK